MGIDILALALEIGSYNASAKDIFVNSIATILQRRQNYLETLHAKILACRFHGSSGVGIAGCNVIKEIQQRFDQINKELSIS